MAGQPQYGIRAQGAEEVSGRGLFLVDAHSSRWGIHEGTTHVWFELRVGATQSGPNPRRPRRGRPEALD
jgi:hypothetical protein